MMRAPVVAKVAVPTPASVPEPVAVLPFAQPPVVEVLPAPTPLVPPAPPVADAAPVAPAQEAEPSTASSGTPLAFAAWEPPRHEIVPMRATANAAPLHGTYYRFRLAGYMTREGAAQSWREVARRAPEIQGAIQIVTERTSLSAKAGLRYAVMSAPLPDLRSAEAACDMLIGRGVACRAEQVSSTLVVRS
jgi:hypothetical protein